MKDNIRENKQGNEWFAIRTRQDKRVQDAFDAICTEIFYPTITVRNQSNKPSSRAAIPHVFFIKTVRENIVALETEGKLHPEVSLPFWIYRYPASDEIQVIPESSVNLLKLITSADSAQCEIFTKADFKENERVRVTGGIYKGYEGFVQRVKKNKHVIVKIEGVCMVMLPFIHPDLLESVD